MSAIMPTDPLVLLAVTYQMPTFSALDMPSTSVAIAFSTSPFATEQPAVGKFKRAKNASEALNTTRALADPGYAYAVLEAYVRGKLARGRNRFQVQHKLDMLERRVSLASPRGAVLCTSLAERAGRVTGVMVVPDTSGECWIPEDKAKMQEEWRGATATINAS